MVPSNPYPVVNQLLMGRWYYSRLIMRGLLDDRPGRYSFLAYRTDCLTKMLLYRLTYGGVFRDLRRTYRVPREQMNRLSPLASLGCNDSNNTKQARALPGIAPIWSVGQSHSSRPRHSFTHLFTQPLN